MIAMTKFSALMAARFRPRSFAIAMSLAAAAALTACGGAGSDPAAVPGAAATPASSGTPASSATPASSGTAPASHRVPSAAVSPAPAGTWTELPAAPVATPPGMVTSVWTGREMIIRGLQFLPLGGWRGVTFAYRPASRTWVRLAPGPQSPGTTLQTSDVAVWTGSRMLVAGLTNGSYDPAANTWRAIPRPGGSMSGAVTGWTGRQFLAWGGTCCDDTTRGGLAYSPAAGAWRTIPDAPLEARAAASGAWTGRELVVAGGRNHDKAFRDAAAYDPAAGTWRKLPRMPGPAVGWTALWDGREVLFLSGSSARGMAYNPARNSWRLLPAMPSPRSEFAATWTGHRVLVWGGLSHHYPTWSVPAHGEAYDPAADQWTAMPVAPLRGRALPAAVWTGRQMIIWGGNFLQQEGGTSAADGAAYTPRTP